MKGNPVWISDINWWTHGVGKLQAKEFRRVEDCIYITLINFKRVV